MSEVRHGVNVAIEPFSRIKRYGNFRVLGAQDNAHAHLQARLDRLFQIVPN